MTRLLALVFCLFLFLALPAPSRAEPAMWVARDADSTIYLFGTFHALPAGMDWRSAKMEAAFASSDELWLEARLDDDAAMQALIARHGLDHSTTLARKLSILERRQLGEALKSLGLPWAAVQSFRPWFAAITLVQASMVKAGFDPAMGADRQLEAAALAAGKPVRALETVTQQIEIFARLGPEAELDMLRQTVAEIGEGAAYFDKLANLWLAGDADGIAAAIVDGVHAQSKPLYEALFLHRNSDWTDQIAAMMAGAGIHFIAVGAGHLVGADSLPAMLTARGIAVAPY